MLALLLAGCQPIPHGGRTAPYIPGVQPDAPRLGASTPAGHTRYDNGSLAETFVALTHDLEWGLRRPHLMRYEDEIRVRLSGPGSARYTAFVDHYLAEIRKHSGVRIRRGANPNLLVRFIPGPAFRARLARHSCLVAPGRLTWETLRSDPERYGSRAYEVQQKLTAMTVFIPDTAEPYLVRTCLIEEIMQALGPVNDLYGLGPSIFNDDAAHVWPTRLDYLMLRVLYDPRMRTGLNRRETRARAREILARLNPQGRGAAPLPRLMQRRMKDWAEDLRRVFDRGASQSRRRDLARTLVATAKRRAPNSAYHCRALMALARTERKRPEQALNALDLALLVCARAHGGNDVRLARIRLDKAHALFRLGRASAAFGASEGLEQVLAAHGLEERLVALYSLQAAALKVIQSPDKSRVARQRAARWGAYALGRDHPSLRPLQAR